MGGEVSNHGSNIPKARKHLDEAMKALKLALKHQRAAQRLMTRRSPVAKAPSSKKPITAAQRAKVIHLWRNTSHAENTEDT
jgi:hypothetical protein